MKKLSNILCLVVVLLTVVEFGESKKRIHGNIRKKQPARFSEPRSLPYEDILRFKAKRRQQIQARLKSENSTITNSTSSNSTLFSNETTTTTPKPPQIVCYGDLGCFSDEAPFDNTGAVPQSPDYIDTKFYVFTRSNPTIEDRQEISYEDTSSLRMSHFNPKNPVKVLIHGFFSNPIDVPPFWPRDAMMEILKRDDMNVIVVDWNKGAVAPNYFAAASNIRVVAAQTAKLIVFLMEETGCSLDQFHLVGHSLGAHTSGLVGARLPGLPRITGLDPAEPFFEDEDPVVRLDAADALFVDVIHTDGGEILSGAWGLDLPVGDVDFYPNGGKGQPGCSNTWVGAISSLFDSSLELTDSMDCSHSRAYQLYIDSINNPCKLIAYPCRSYDDFVAGRCWDCSNNACPVMGYDVDSNLNARGSVYLSTGENAPYCAYEYRVVLKTKPGMTFCRGQITINIAGTYQSTGPMNFFEGDSEGIDADREYVGIFASNVRLDTVKELTLTYTRTTNFLFSWGSYGDLELERVDIQSNVGMSASSCGDTIVRENGMVTIATFNKC
ncbi:pancreatic lipase-related protein 2-like [Branchiostoma lanceolatum]|uniref:pancreatic lipase-related protein 2-like n=1 Tax=Branchiostoma lanceolatum TaxID=7740 RepID=UPI0034569EC1